jgi:hypothetical protein
VEEKNNESIEESWRKYINKFELLAKRYSCNENKIENYINNKKNKINGNQIRAFQKKKIGI